ncbi:unnamed protein product, partial [Rotaria sp. Silwood1]
DLLNNYKLVNDTDPVGLLLSLFTCIGHFCDQSTVNIRNHITNLNIFLLLIGPSGCGKSKIISPIKKAVIETIKSLGISKDEAGVIDEFTTASLSAKLAKSNAFIITDEAEKPLLSLSFYSPLSEGSASDRISGCKFFGTIPTTKDTMTDHLEIASHLSFVGATTGRLSYRLINYYAQRHQSDDFCIMQCQRRKDSTLNTPQSLDYNDIDDEDNDNEEDLSDVEYESERLNSIKENLPSLTQILIVARLIGKREFVLSRNGTKKFYNKIHQYQELSQREKSDDVNYGSRLGESAEILCKLAGISEIVKIALEILKILQDQNQLKYDDTSFSFIRNATQVIENKYSSQTMVLEIQSSSCHLTGYLFCSHLIKMLFAIYNIEPVLLNDKKTAIETISPFITTTSRAIVHMKSYPSNDILNDPIKRSVVDRIFNDAEMDLQSYMITLSNSIIKQKQVLTMNGKQVLMLPEHQLLYENLKRKYPERNLDDIHASNNIDNVTIANNLRLHSETTSSQSTDNQPRSNQDIAVKVISGKVLSHQNDEQTYTPLNQLLQQLHTNSRIEQSHNMSSSNNNIYISPTDVLLGILEFCKITSKSKQ